MIIVFIVKSSFVKNIFTNNLKNKELIMAVPAGFDLTRSFADQYQPLERRAFNPATVIGNRYEAAAVKEGFMLVGFATGIGVVKLLTNLAGLKVGVLLVGISAYAHAIPRVNNVWLKGAACFSFVVATVYAGSLLGPEALIAGGIIAVTAGLFDLCFKSVLVEKWLGARFERHENNRLAVHRKASFEQYQDGLLAEVNAIRPILLVEIPGRLFQIAERIGALTEEKKAELGVWKAGDMGLEEYDEKYHVLLGDIKVTSGEPSESVAESVVRDRDVYLSRVVSRLASMMARDIVLPEAQTAKADAVRLTARLEVIVRLQEQTL
jgi:hypothetical protein